MEPGPSNPISTFLIRQQTNPWPEALPSCWCSAYGRAAGDGDVPMHLRGMREDGVKIPRRRHRAVTPRRTSRQVDFYAMVEVAA